MHQEHSSHLLPPQQIFPNSNEKTHQIKNYHSLFGESFYYAFIVLNAKTCVNVVSLVWANTALTSTIGISMALSPHHQPLTLGVDKCVATLAECAEEDLAH